jgi:hypothetical protein
VKPSNATFRLPTNASRCHTNGLETSLVRQNSLKVSQTQEVDSGSGSECEKVLSSGRMPLCCRTEVVEGS